LHPSPNIVKVIRSRRISWAGYAALTTNKKNSYKIMVENHTEIGWVDVERIHLVQDRK
jgi:hypothetical protein